MRKKERLVGRAAEESRGGHEIGKGGGGGESGVQWAPATSTTGETRKRKHTGINTLSDTFPKSTGTERLGAITLLPANYSDTNYSHSISSNTSHHHGWKRACCDVRAYLRRRGGDRGGLPLKTLRELDLKNFWLLDVLSPIPAVSLPLWT